MLGGWRLQSIDVVYKLLTQQPGFESWHVQQLKYRVHCHKNVSYVANGTQPPSPHHCNEELGTFFKNSAIQKFLHLTKPQRRRRHNFLLRLKNMGVAGLLRTNISVLGILVDSSKTCGSAVLSPQSELVLFLTAWPKPRSRRQGVLYLSATRALFERPQRPQTTSVLQRWGQSD